MLMLKARPAVLAGGLALAIGFPAHAQMLGNPGEVGLLDLLPGIPGANRVNVTLSGTATYDTNVSHEGASEAALQGLHQSDVVYSPTATVDILQPFGRGSASLSGTASYNFYERNTVLNREALDLKAALKHPVSICNLTLSGDYQRGLDQLPNVTSAQVRDTYTNGHVKFDGQCGRPVGIAPIFSVSESWTDNSEKAFEASNAHTVGATAGLSYQSPVSGVLSVSGVYQKTTYPGIRAGDGALRNNNYDTDAVNVKYVRTLGARIQGSVSASYTTVSSSQSSDFQGLTYEADLSYRASSRLNLEGSFNREVIPSNLIGASYQLQTDLTGRINYQIGPRLAFSVGASQQVGDEEGIPAELAQLVPLSHYDMRSVFSSLKVSLIRRVTCTFDVQNDLRTTNQAQFNYSDTRASVTLSAQF